MASQSYVNVRFAPYHARGDGIADDYPAIQRAVDVVLAGGGGIVYIPAGRYLLRSGHVVPTSAGVGRNVTFSGEGADISILVLGSPGACMSDCPEGESTDLEIRNLLGFDAGGFWGSSCVVLASVRGLQIDGCSFAGTASQPALKIGRAQNYYMDPAWIPPTPCSAPACT